MEINITKPVKVNAKTLKIHVKCSDRFGYQIADQHGEVIYQQDDGYVPDFMPGAHYRDYIILDIDIDSGVVVNWSKPTAADIEAVLNGSDD